MTDFWEALVEGTLQEEYYAEKALKSILQEMDRYSFEHMPYTDFLKIHTKVRQVLDCIEGKEATEQPETEKESPPRRDDCTGNEGKLLS